MIHVDILIHRIDALIRNLERNSALVKHKDIEKRYRQPVYGKFARATNPLIKRLGELKSIAQKVGQDQNQYIRAWNEYNSLLQSAKKIFDHGLDFLGGIAVRDTGLEKGACDLAEAIIQDCVDRKGANWYSLVIPSKEPGSFETEEQITQIIHLPIPHWDMWYLPLLVHSFCLQFLINKSNPRLSSFIEAHCQMDVGWINNLLLSEDDLEIYLEHLVADVLATFCMGTTYAYALLFLILDPSDPFSEGKRGNRIHSTPSSPCDARRMAIVLQTLRAMDQRAKRDDYSPGLYESDIKLLETIWENALEIMGSQVQFLGIQAEIAGLGTQIIQTIEKDYSYLTDETADRYEKSRNEVVPKLLEGSDQPIDPIPDLPLLLGAAWRVRARHPDQIDILTRDCERLRHGKHPPMGLQAPTYKADLAAKFLFLSRLHDLETSLTYLRAPLNSPRIDREDRASVSGRFYRLLSEQVYALKKFQKLFHKGAQLSHSLSLVLRQVRDPGMEALRTEMLEFLGGALIRSKGLDDNACANAESLLRDYSTMTGVNWNARVVLGISPLFSTASELIHIQFPDWDIWNLPLMAHEFGHVTALGTQQFLSLQATELTRASFGYPGADSWDDEDLDNYVKERSKHIHEFFADAFAIYCQGPAFAYNVFWLHFNPLNAYLPRGDHPTHGERMEVILKVLEKMNERDKADPYHSGPFGGTLNRLDDWWTQVSKLTDSEPDKIYLFHKLKARDISEKLFNLLEKYYGLGAQYRGKDWNRAVDIAKVLLSTEVDLGNESRRDLLNIAWACRIRYPDQISQIEKIVLSAFQKLESHRQKSLAISEGV